ncbi:hypothetical protein TSACC_22796 [Terrimicrobium sacchariphilum]|uniref:Lipoprotein n=1 Tax=Terrimicrobium sacchariphilum TaxID=690879 RepID=A0A146GAC0_TERSA|nr:DUF4410 domain-containing protein [Terrimicrobium sacchariphilum]GAT34371.1 hypothetical protein TSACC_22796 [Terrimicrobium sacchariphilum]
MRYFLSLASVMVLTLTGCSSVGVYQLHQHKPAARTAPRTIFIQAYTIQPGALQLGDRPAAETARLGRDIQTSLASRTSREVSRHAAPAMVAAGGTIPAPGNWLIRGEIVQVDQGSRAKRAVVGLGAGRTHFRTNVSVFAVESGGMRRILSFRTRGSSGMEPGAALGVATGGASLVGTAAGTLAGSLPGVSSDVDRTAYETAAVLSTYLANQGLLSRSRQQVTPNFAGQVPSGFNVRRALPTPVRDAMDSH